MPSSKARFTIRPAQQADRAGICNVHRSAIMGICITSYSAPDVSTWAGLLQPEAYREVITKNFMVVAVDRNGEIIGFGQLEPVTGEVQAVYVLPSATGMGVGGALLATLEAEASRRGLTRLFLHSTLNAESFYSAHRYRPLGKKPHHLTPEVTLPCIEMEKRLG